MPSNKFKVKINKNTIKALLVRFWFTAQMAGHGILANPLRSALTILGVAIGVASVVSLMGIGEGARQAVVEQFKSLGTNVIAIEAHDESVEFDPEEANELVERVQGLDMASPIIYTEADITWRRTRGSLEIFGVNNHFPEIRDHEILSGHFFTYLHVEQRSPVAVLGYNLGSRLLGGRSPVGHTITIDGRSFRIIGILGPKGAGQAEDIDDKIVIPYTTAMQIADTRKVTEIWGKAETEREADLAVVQLGRIFRRQLGIDQGAPAPGQPGEEQSPDGQMPPGGGVEQPMPDQPGGEPEEPESSPISDEDELVSITNLNQLVDEVDQANRVMTLLLGGIAAVSLLVGGLGIMNIMLVAVTERTEEIGIRRALGAKQGDLLTQFILEALYLSGIGAIAGIAIGIWGVNIFTRYGFETVVSLQAIKVATVVALGCGLIFGVYPAYSASSLPPVQALRRQ